LWVSYILTNFLIYLKNDNCEDLHKIYENIGNLRFLALPVISQQDNGRKDLFDRVSLGFSLFNEEIK